MESGDLRIRCENDSACGPTLNLAVGVVCIQKTNGNEQTGSVSAVTVLAGIGLYALVFVATVLRAVFTCELVVCVFGVNTS